MTWASVIVVVVAVEVVVVVVLVVLSSIPDDLGILVADDVDVAAGIGYMKISDEVYASPIPPPTPSSLSGSGTASPDVGTSPVVSCLTKAADAVDDFGGGGVGRSVDWRRGGGAGKASSATPIILL